MIELLKSGGLLIIPIVVCGLAATFIIVERFLYFYTIKKNDNVLFSKIDPLLAKKEYQSVYAVCETFDTPNANVIKKAIKYRHYSTEDIKDAVMTEANNQVPLLEKFLTTLGTIANISTLLGLLGTVSGNIAAFGVLGSGGSMGDPAVLAGAIAEALVTTAAGLGVSIPSIIFHNYFISRTNKMVISMESRVTDIILGMSNKSITTTVGA